MFDGRKETLRQQEKYTNLWWKVERGEKRGAITGERHSYRIWAQISLIITACTATYVLHRLSRTRSYLPVPTLKDTSPCGVRPVSLMMMMDDYDCNFRGNAAPIGLQLLRRNEAVSLYVYFQRWCLAKLKDAKSIRVNSGSLEIEGPLYWRKTLLTFAKFL